MPVHHFLSPQAYNAGMGSPAQNAEMESEKIAAWLASGGLVVAASERAARALTSAFHRNRLREGLTAWPAPQILDFHTFIHSAWLEHSSDPRLILNPVQEQSLWASVARDSGVSAPTLLPGPLHRLAALAMEAHGLFCAYAPQLLRTAARSGWVNDPAAFSRWLATFEETCRAKNMLSPARLPIELIPILEASSASRPPLLLAGFDRITPTQRTLFAAWGECRELTPSDSTASIHFHRAAHQQAEFEACALWAAQRLAANPAARILILTQDASTRRGEIERALFRHLPSPASAPLFEFSLGVPLSQIPLPRAAHLLLRWLSDPLAENELDWLLASGHACATNQETAALQAHMRALRHRGLERPEWTLRAFLDSATTNSAALPAAWIARFGKAQARLALANRQPQSPIEWADLVPRLLEDLAWPGARPLSSAQFQAHRRFLQAVDSSGSLGFDGRRIRWSDWISILARTLDQTLYAPESRDAPIQIAGPAESAGLSADAIWFLGANEDNWPATGSTHPLLPIEVQRARSMPHATAQLDWNLAHIITNRLIHSATDIRFSCAQQVEGTPARPSRLIAQLAGPPLELPPEFNPAPTPKPLAQEFNDASLIPFPPGQAPGGSDVLTAQSNCPFKAFATTRLDAKGWDPAAAGLTPAQRGQLLHAVLHSVWGGPPLGIRTRTDLNDKIASGLRPFVETHVDRAISGKLAPAVRERMPVRYLELEAERLTRLIAEWLTYESARAPFTVIGTEVTKNTTVDGLELRLRLDRIDQLIDHTLLVVDYKSGNVSPKAWDSARPEDIQLPLYATFALDDDEDLGGLVFAKVLAGKPSFAGRAVDAQATLLTSLSNSSDLVKVKLTPGLQETWSESIKKLAREFLRGRADVDPRDYPKTCKNCDLHAVCRIHENLLVLDDDDQDEEAADD
jgi:ATP-dependent helicase/nuclease subunit B